MQTLGRQFRLKVSALGLGCAGMAEFYGRRPRFSPRFANSQSVLLPIVRLPILKISKLAISLGKGHGLRMRISDVICGSLTTLSKWRLRRATQMSSSRTPGCSRKATTSSAFRAPSKVDISTRILTRLRCRSRPANLGRSTKRSGQTLLPEGTIRNQGCASLRAKGDERNAARPASQKVLARSRPMA
jgi:hypothetical protein